MIVIPAVDILGGRPVRLLKGDYGTATVYGDSPLEAALRWEWAGARWLHVVDLDGAREGSMPNREHVREILRSTRLSVQVGGGVRSLEQVGQLIGWGAERVVIGTASLDDPTFLAEACSRYPGRIVAALDTRSGEVAVRGWLEGSGKTLLDAARAVEKLGAARILFTAIEADGTLAGPNVAAIEELLSAVRVPVIASGGVGSERDLDALEATGVEAVIVGRALYEGRVPLSALTRRAGVT